MNPRLSLIDLVKDMCVYSFDFWSLPDFTSASFTISFSGQLLIFVAPIFFILNGA